MSSLHCVEKPTRFVDWFTYAHVRERGELGLDEWLAMCYGREGRFQVCEAANDTTYVMRVEAKEPEECDNEALHATIESGDVDYWQLGILLNDACLKGYLESGEYVVSVSW